MRDIKCMRDIKISLDIKDMNLSGIAWILGITRKIRFTIVTVVRKNFMENKNKENQQCQGCKVYQSQENIKDIKDVWDINDYREKSNNSFLEY